MQEAAMAGKQKPPTKPGWQLSFDISPEMTLTRDRQPCHRATAIIRHGDLAFMAEVELVHWAEDIAAFFSRARAVFTAGAPEFPDMAGEAPTADPASTGEVEGETDPEAVSTGDVPDAGGEACEESGDEYDITFYPAGGGADGDDPAQPALW